MELILIIIGVILVIAIIFMVVGRLRERSFTAEFDDPFDPGQADDPVLRRQAQDVLHGFQERP